MKRRRRELSSAEIRRRYREILERPDLTDQKIDRLRAPVRLLAQAICEHVWGKKVY